MAMSKEELQNRLEKLEVRIEKIKKRIQKWENKKNVEGYVKENSNSYYSCKGNLTPVRTLDDLVRCRFIYFNGRDTMEECEEFVQFDYKSYLSGCEKEIKYANRDLEDAELTKQKYLNALLLVDERESKPVIQIFKNFFNNWKKEILEFVDPLVTLFYQVNRNLTDWYNNKWSLLQTMTNEKWSEKCAELREKQNSIEEIRWVKKAIDLRYKRNKKEFINYIDKYMEQRYYELVQKVTKFTGDIVDVSDLRVGFDGTLNGIVTGKEGKAKLETIIAGGYNTHRIVNVKRGQIKHYRVLVHKVK